MRKRWKLGILFTLPFLMVASDGWAASYQKVDGTIVDPIRRCEIYDLDPVAPAPIHPYAGPNVAPGASLVGASLSGADLRQADLAGTDLGGANLTNACLLGADLSNSTLSGASLGAARYDQSTIFPVGFDPQSRFMQLTTYISNGLAPPNPSNLFDDASLDLLINNAGCDASIERPCTAPGDPTAVSGTAQTVWLFDSSKFSGTVWSGISLFDSSTADVTVICESCGVSAYDDSTLTVNANVWLEIDLGASGDAFVMAGGGRWEDVHVRDRAHVVLSGGEADGAFFEVDDEGLLEINQATWDLHVSGGRAILRGETISGVAVEPEGVLELQGGALTSDRPYRFSGNQISGSMRMTSGVIGPGDFRVDGFAAIDDGSIRAEPSSSPPPIAFPGPWNFSSFGSGLIEVAGGAFNEFVSLGARDASRIRLFGSGFAVDGTPASPGALLASTGALTGTLSNGDPIDNPFAHRGADCGGQPCTGRILVLAPGLDWDQDAVPNPFDNCAEEPNVDQADLDEDGTGDVCFAPVDLDRDGIVDAIDNCRVDANPDQLDSDADGVGDACDDSLAVWTDPGTSGCTTPPQPAPYATVTGDLADGDFIDRAAQPCDCMGLELPADPGVASVRFLHVSPAGVVKEVCENAAPYAFGLAPGQPICSTSLAQDGPHAVMVTPYDAPDCEAGGGSAMASSIRRFAVPAPGMAESMAAGLLVLSALSRRRAW